MSKKHEQRARAEIIAKRQQPIAEVRVIRTIGITRCAATPL